MRPEDVRAEQQAFETWAVAQGYDMTQHPLHYLFLDPKTNAARKVWNASLAAGAPLIAAMEREACAIAATQRGYDCDNLDERNGCFFASAAIRARGDA